MPRERLDDWNGARVTVMGLGRFGGALGAIRFLAARGARVTVTDTEPESQLGESLGELREVSLAAVHLGGHREEDFTQADFIVASPAVPRINRYLQLAGAAGIPVSSEMNLFWQYNRGTVIAVTGSNGKSTTTALTHSLLKQSGRTCWLGGNIGKSLLPEVDAIQPGDLVVLELSSFQLEDLNRLKASPHGAIVTNFSPNHLDWHGTLENYRSAKQTILRWQQQSDFAVLNAADDNLSSWSTQGERLLFGLNDAGVDGAFLQSDGTARIRRQGRETVFPLRQWLRLPGRHNLDNALAATCAAMAIGATLDEVRRGIESYEPLPHRLQFVAEKAGRRFYNDSLATTPESAVVALEAFEAPVILLSGGYDKKVDLSVMAKSIAVRTKAVALMGQTAPFLQRSILASVSKGGGPTLRICSNFEEAFAWAASQSKPGDVVLLSPGCASYDWFRNFADRGDQFTRMAESWQPDDR